MVGWIVSGAVAVAVCVCGVRARLPSTSRSVDPDGNEKLRVMVTNAPFGAADVSPRIAVVTPLSAAALHIGTPSPNGGSGSPLTTTVHSVGPKKASSPTGLLKVTVARLALTAAPV